MTARKVVLCLVALAAGVCGATPVAAESARVDGAARVSDAELAPARALCKQARWGEAVAAFEELLSSAPNDARVLSELGWAAFLAGDHRKARTTLERSISMARDRRIKAASLYSLGRVEEAAGRPDRAARRYRASLALRANDTVQGRFHSVEYIEPEPLPLSRLDEEPFCTESRPLQDVCACVLPRIFSDEKDVKAGSCALLGSPRVGAYRVLSAKGRSDISTVVLLVEELRQGWVVRGVIDRSEGWAYSITGLEGETIGARRGLRFRTDWIGHHESWKSKNGFDVERGTVTVFAIPSDGGAPGCVLRITVREYNRQYTFGDDITEEVEETTFRVDVGEDGLAQVVLVKGVAPEKEGLLGLHRLW